MKKLLQFGAGNIGRSFTGQLFSAAGYEVVFADVDERLINALNEKRCYTVSVRDNECRNIEVKNVRAIKSTDTASVMKEMADADICATAVGPFILPKLFEVIAQGLIARNGRPIDIILCENLRDAASIVRNGLTKILPTGSNVEKMVGLVETSIGKMVPIIPESVRKNDPLTVFAESYNTLILDGKAFLNGIPDVKGLSPKNNMKAWVDRKSFIHNLGHAALAYLSFAKKPQLVYTWEAAVDPELRAATRSVMLQAGNWLVKTYPTEFDNSHIEKHTDELLDRFANKTLGDTLHRVGRDLTRKLSPEDRVVGALKACFTSNLPYNLILNVLVQGLRFCPPDLDGNNFAPDMALIARVKAEGAEAVLKEISKIDGVLLSEAVQTYNTRSI
ncbi:MAG: mannitol-1-phosphate 5-dehydrogenase [Fibrobacteres bacterium]|nr:mannitol-1-phosphate 5-dehydrogenase [Fibrobacterota bacterium]